MAQAGPPVSLTTALAEYPCTGPRCLSEQQQLALLAFLLAALITPGVDADGLETVIKRYRGASRQQLLQVLIGSFADANVASATADALKCWNCYSVQELNEIITYLLSRAIVALSLPT